ncbi:Hypothetical predicted protein [Paramuricea clavata]|uniref:Uncharacterized protein n=1 Tax=Paramuricea clavata TaxID=317549 RepID=A0A6S7H4R7_PARCT|nr:Hypothetical predicted protein [Paramuricea clavata]
MTLCLAKPKWIWFDEEDNGGNFNDEVLTRGRGKNDENLIKEWKKAYDRSEKQQKKRECEGKFCG